MPNRQNESGNGLSLLLSAAGQRCWSSEAKRNLLLYCEGKSLTCRKAERSGSKYLKVKNRIRAILRGNILIFVLHSSVCIARVGCKVENSL